MSVRDYAILDVFSDVALGGNPLAVVFDADDLSDEKMLAIAREFNLSETVFICTPDNSAHNAKLRIFLPTGEIPFAGHPCVGASVAIAQKKWAGFSQDAALIVMEVRVGLVRAMVTRGEECSFGEFDIPQLPKSAGYSLTREGVAASLGLKDIEIGFENHVISSWNAGLPYIFVPVHDLECASKAKFDERIWMEQFSGLDPFDAPCPYVYCRETVFHESSFHARMFAAHHGIGEDPATGSAAAAFAGVVHEFDRPVDGMHRLVVEQGIEMQRPSMIQLEIKVEAQKIDYVRIGGNVVQVASGQLFI